MEIKKEIAFTTDPMGEADSIGVEFTPELLERIKKVMGLVKEGIMNSGTIWHYGYEMYCDDEVSDVKTDGGEIRIFDERFYYYTQGKYTAELQYETDSFTIQEVEDMFNQQEA